MKRLLGVVVALLLVAATAGEVVPGLESDGYYVESGSTATESVVSNAVFDARASGGRLYIVVLADEPPGGATTFADSVLDDLGTGYVLVVAPDTVGYAGDGSFWQTQEMDRAIDASLQGSNDDAVVRLFVGSLSGGDGEPGQGTSSGGTGWLWALVIAAGAVIIWLWIRRQSKATVQANLERAKATAREKLDEVANDVIEMEDEVRLSDDLEVKRHYQRASATYTTALQTVERAETIKELLDVTSGLDEAIWELDAAEALLDGKPIPPKPVPPVASPAPSAEQPEPTSTPTGGGFDRRPQRRSSYGSQDLMNVLMAILASQGPGRGGLGGGFSGIPLPGRRSSGGGARRSMGGSGRIRGGGRRGG